MTIINPNPPRVTVKLGDARFQFIEDQRVVEQPQSMNEVPQFLVIAYHMLKGLVIELEKRGILEVIREDSGEKKTGSALDDIKID